MMISEFLERVEEHPRLALVHKDGTICVIRYAGPDGSRDIRIGFWAVQERQWEQLLQALSIPLEAAVA
jgi:sirohydrochlorin ferrochelatase